MANLPADLPENWTSGQIISPNGTEVGLDEKHGYNYLMQQVNAAQEAINAAQGNIDAINQALETVAQEATLQTVKTEVEQTQTAVGSISTKIGASGDSGTTTVMGKLNKINTNVAVSSGGFKEYTSPGTYTFTVPAGVTVLSITACGGGGGGGYYDYDAGHNGGGAGGGGAAAAVGRKVTVTPGQALTITVGAGGAAGGGSTSDGKSTVIGTLLTLPGGKGAPEYYGAGGNAGGDGGGHGGRCGGNNVAGIFSNSGYQINWLPESGRDGICGCGGNIGRDTRPDYQCGAGGGGSLGNGGNGAGESTAATAGSRGGGGGGAYRAKSNYAKGGDGYVRLGWGVCMD